MTRPIIDRALAAGAGSADRPQRRPSRRAATGPPGPTHSARAAIIAGLTAPPPPPPPRPSHAQPEPQDARAQALQTALVLSAASVGFGAVSGALSVTAGVLDHSLGVLGAGLGVLADLAGSVMLIWRFRSEQRHAGGADAAEERATVVIAVTLAIIGVVLLGESVAALAAGTRPGGSALALVAAGLAVVVLTPLARAKRRTAALLGSPALRGDSTLSAIGAATALLALVGLLLFHALGWWWADRVVGLLVAVVAAVESRSLMRHRRA
jgi:divalent metal cation (Fe/Co/Zn/Cd) transporter